jgi:hypothetical protein
VYPSVIVSLENGRLRAREIIAVSEGKSQGVLAKLRDGLLNPPTLYKCD